MKLPVCALIAGLLLSTASHNLYAHSNDAHASTGPVIKEQTAWGIAGDADRVERTIEVVMSDDMRFTPSGVTVQEGETVRIVVKNDGKLMHELVIGNKASLEEHAELMLRFPDMEHDEPYMAHVPPGEIAEIIWTFNQPGDLEFACLLPGHYQAGMLATVRVTPAPVAANESAQNVSIRRLNTP